MKIYGIATIIALFLLATTGCVKQASAPTASAGNATFSGKESSHASILTYNETGCQYVVMHYSSYSTVVITPRMIKGGVQACQANNQ